MFSYQKSQYIYNDGACSCSVHLPAALASSLPEHHRCLTILACGDYKVTRDLQASASFKLPIRSLRRLRMTYQSVLSRPRAPHVTSGNSLSQPNAAPTKITTKSCAFPLGYPEQCQLHLHALSKIATGCGQTGLLASQPVGTHLLLGDACAHLVMQK